LEVVHLSIQALEALEESCTKINITSRRRRWRKKRFLGWGGLGILLARLSLLILT
jgi:hypothetical protein